MANKKYMQSYEDKNQVNALHILIKRIYVVGQSINIYLVVDLHG